MTTFLRLLSDKDKSAALDEAVQALRSGAPDERLFTVEPEAFRQVPGAPFAYWVSDVVQGAFERLPAFESKNRSACFGLSTKNDNSFLRLNWEIQIQKLDTTWFAFVKGGMYSPFYADPHLVIDWEDNGSRLKAFADHRTRQIWLFGIFRDGAQHLVFPDSNERLLTFQVELYALK